MGTSLLDFVMALVRNPDAAARYAADPAAALAVAGLAGVTSADVDNLLPVVTDSLAMSSPDLSGRSDLNDAGVWASGAAAVAFEAFGAVAPIAPPMAMPMGIVVPPAGSQDSDPIPEHAGPTLPGRPAADQPGTADPGAGTDDALGWDSHSDLHTDLHTEVPDSVADSWNVP